MPFHAPTGSLDSSLQAKSGHAALESKVQQAQHAVQAESQRREAAEIRAHSLENELSTLRLTQVFLVNTMDNRCQEWSTTSIAKAFAQWVSAV